MTMMTSERVSAEWVGSFDNWQALDATVEVARTVARDVTAVPQNFEIVLAQLENLVNRFQVILKTCNHPEAESALRYHRRASLEIASEFVPLYYRRAVLDNVLARYIHAGSRLCRQATPVLG